MAVASDYGIEVGQVLTPPEGRNWLPRLVVAVWDGGRGLTMRLASNPSGLGHSYLVDDFAKDAELKRVGATRE